MAVNTSNRFIVQESENITLGMSDSNHVQQFLKESPELFTQLITKTFAARRISSNPLTELTEGRGKVKILSGATDSWTWQQEIAQRPARLVEDFTVTNPLLSTTNIGIDGQPFRVKLDKDWFTSGMHISTDKRLSLRIGQEAPYRESNGWVYTCYLITDSPGTDSYPYSYLAPGTEYVELSSSYGEFSSQGAISHLQGNIKLINYLPDMVRHMATITGYADEKVLKIANVTVDPVTGKTLQVNDKKWMRRVELQFWSDFYQAIEDKLFYERGSTHLKGEGGYNIRTNYGLKQQLEWGNVETYTSFTEKLLREFFMDIFFGRVSAEKRDVVMLTGEYGFMLFDEAMKRSTSGLFFNSDKFTTGAGMDMGYGFQFTKYYPINGGSITLKYLPSLDTRVTNTMRSTKTGYPMESATFYILDLSGEKQDNIWMVRHADSKSFGYEIGTSAPWPLKGSIISNTKDGYTMVARDRVGLHVEDLSRTGILKLQEN